MKIKHYSYNTFIIENGRTKIAIDPGLNLSLCGLGSIIPRSEWKEVTHILVTHGDLNHYWFADKLAKVSNAPIICGKRLVKKIGEELFILNPLDKEIHYTTRVDQVYPLEAGAIVELDGVSIKGIRTIHGPLTMSFIFGLVRILRSPGPRERFGLGSIGFMISIDGYLIINLGDSLLLQGEWRELKGIKPDVLMIPIGGREIPNTMNERDALEAVRLFSPKSVIPCHYNNDFLWKMKANKADDRYFKEEIDKMRLRCYVIPCGGEIEL